MINKKIFKESYIKQTPHIYQKLNQIADCTSYKETCDNLNIWTNNKGLLKANHIVLSTDALKILRNKEKTKNRNIIKHYIKNKEQNNHQIYGWLLSDIINSNVNLKPLTYKNILNNISE